MSSRPLAMSSSPKFTIGTRREDPARIWKRRCPLTPDAVEELTHKDGIDVLIPLCDRRVFPVYYFVEVWTLFETIPRLSSTSSVQAGTKLHATLEPAHTVIGIKEAPLNELTTTPMPAPTLSGCLILRTHFMFCHGTTKGQPYFWPVL